MSEFNQRVKFVGASRRKSKDGEKVYASARFTAAAKQTADNVGESVVEYDCDPSLFAQFQKMPYGTPASITLEQFEWTKDGITQSRMSLVGVEPIK
jgi:hypothetical protein